MQWTRQLLQSLPLLHTGRRWQQQPQQQQATSSQLPALLQQQRQPLLLRCAVLRLSLQTGTT
jgi:hypothetical protein